MSILARASRRHLLRHPWQLGLAVLGIALGVAVFVSVDLANRSARRAFDLTTDTMAGRATHQLLGGPSGIPDAVYVRLRQARPVAEMAPIVVGYARGLADGRTLEILGVDPVADVPFRGWVNPSALGLSGDLGPFLTEPDSALVSAESAAELGLAVGDRLQVVVNAAETSVRIGGLLQSETRLQGRALANVLLMDIAAAKDLLGLDDRLTRVDLRLPDGADGERALAAIAEILPPGVELRAASTSRAALYEMTRAFRLNLTALSLLALLVGMYLIYNTMTFSVVERRRLIGRLRALGVTRRQVFTLVLGEALVIGMTGTALGLGLGIVLASGLVRLVTRTMNDMYFVLSVRELAVSPGSLLLGLGLGTLATVVAAVAPAHEATTAPPRLAMSRSAVETRARGGVGRAAGIGLVAILLGGGLLAIPSRSLVLSFAALFAIVVGCSLEAPMATVAMMRLGGPLLGRWFGLLGRMAARGVVQTLSRTGIAIAALTIAISVSVGVGVMVASFRETVVRWLEVTLQADVYVAPRLIADTRTEGALDPSILARLDGLPGVAERSSIRGVHVAWPGGSLGLAVLEPAAHTRRSFRLKEGSAEIAWPAFADGGALITEPLAYRHGLGVGDDLVMTSDRGPIALPIVGVVYDYGSDLGMALVSRRTYRRYWDDPAVSGVSFVAATREGVDGLVRELRRRMGDAEQAVIVRSNVDLREASLEVFDRTFTITSVLRLLVTGVAFIGVLSALMALALERAREIAVLRANGLTPAQVWQLVVAQTGLMGLVAGVLSIPLGLIMAAVMIYVINRRSFGWTIEMTVGPEALVSAVALAVVAALLAGLYPAYRMARTSPAEMLREE